MTADQISKNDYTVASVGDGVNQAGGNAVHAEVIACLLTQE
jgi:hypothetical protein